MNRIKILQHILKLTPVFGVCFWFLLLFPFGNRNEGYLWVAYFEQFNFFEILVNPIPSIITNRPLAQGVAWLLYFVSGGNAILIQFLNFILLCFSFVLLTEYSKNKNTGLLYLIVGFIYISSFYYIFNLHGIFYSPLLLLMAILIRNSNSILTNWKVWIVVIFCLSFFHPFVVIIYLAFIFGLIIEIGRYTGSEIKIVILNSVILLAPVIFYGGGTQLDSIEISNLIGAFRNVEANSIIKIFSIALVLPLVIQRPKFERIIYFLSALIYVPLAVRYNLPLLILAGLILIVTLLIDRKWSLLGLVGASILFPLVVKSGAPTKVSLFLFLLPFLVSNSLILNFRFDATLRKTIALVAIVPILIVVILVRMEIQIPIVSSFIKPLLVERGKSKQLANCIDIALLQKTGVSIKYLQDDVGKIRDLGQPLKRDYLPVTKQSELDEYLRIKMDYSKSNNWYISFGEPIVIDSLQLHMTIEEINTKPLFVYTVNKSE